MCSPVLIDNDRGARGNTWLPSAVERATHMNCVCCARGKPFCTPVGHTLAIARGVRSRVLLLG